MNRDQLVREKLRKEESFIRPCCNDTHNLRYALSDNNRKDILVLKCKHCHALHRRQFMEGMKLKGRG